jgi:hypothetical protein
VFIKVNIASLNEYSKLISLKDNKIVNKKSEIIKITIVRKYLPEILSYKINFRKY